MLKRLKNTNAMRRADRLFRIVEYLKARRQVVTAVSIAQALEVSTRTIYRDIADLNASGVPIIGEAGVGLYVKSQLCCKAAYVRDRRA